MCGVLSAVAANDESGMIPEGGSDAPTALQCTSALCTMFCQKIGFRLSSLEGTFRGAKQGRRNFSNLYIHKRQRQAIFSAQRDIYMVKFPKK